MDEESKTQCHKNCFFDINKNLIAQLCLATGHNLQAEYTDNKSSCRVSQPRLFQFVFAAFQVTRKRASSFYM